HKGRHSLFLYNSEIFYAFTQDILRSRLVERGHNLKPDTVIHTAVDNLKDTTGYKFVVRCQILFHELDNEQAQQMVDEALDTCPVAKLLKANENVTFEVVDKFSF
ncbi:hypothetical protein ABQ284_13355, partial [Lentilactobacillus buchneri]